jgi:hypothetical protein
MRLRTFVVILILAVAIASIAVAVRSHGGLHRWVMAIHGR